MPRKWAAALLATAALTVFAAGCGNDAPQAENIQTVKDVDIKDAATLAVQDVIRAKFPLKGDGTKSSYAKDFVGSKQIHPDFKYPVSRIVLTGLSAGHGSLGSVNGGVTVRTFCVDKVEHPDVEITLSSKMIGGKTVDTTSYEDYVTIKYRDKTIKQQIGTRHGGINGGIAKVPGRIEIYRTSDGFLRIDYIASDGKEEKLVDKIETKDEIYGLYGEVYTLFTHGHAEIFE